MASRRRHQPHRRAEALLKAQQGKGPAPVEKWNPPYCGDIGMKIRADGVWIYGGSPIGRMPLVKLFAGVLRKDADGKHYLVTPAEKVDVAVEDAPFLAVEMEVQGSGARAEPDLPHQRRRHRHGRPRASAALRGRDRQPGPQALPPRARPARGLVTRAIAWDLAQLGNRGRRDG